LASGAQSRNGCVRHRERPGFDVARLRLRLRRGQPSRGLACRSV